MTDVEDQPSRFIRARQRDPNSSMVGFGASLLPHIDEVGIDALHVSVSGMWVSHSGNGLARFENALNLTDVDWLNRPDRQRTKITVELSQRRNTSTLSSFEIAIWSAERTQGQLRIKARLNPTRTLHHRIAQYLALRESNSIANNIRFIEHLNLLVPTEFFSKSYDLQTGVINDLSTSLDGNDNWLPYSIEMREVLGRSFWPSFLDIFATNVRRFCILLLGENSSAIPSGAMDHIYVTDGEILLDWENIRVPQIECYFERYHRAATSAVRYGTWQVLAADHSSEARLYANPETFERDSDRFSVIQTLPNSGSLAIYAKRQDRIRFEVRRKGKGNYRDVPVPLRPEQKLIDILALERSNLLTAIRWPQIGELFAGPDFPNLHDLRVMIDEICRASGDNANSISQLLTSLLVDGAISVSRSASEDIQLKQIIRQLVKGGLLELSRTRSRDLNGSKRRYLLKAPYRDIHALLADPLSAHWS